MGYIHIPLFFLLFVNYSFKWVVCCQLGDMKCKDCSPGYVGSNCTEQCRYPNYGTDCQGHCNCSKEFCDIATGCFSPKDGCRAGYYGDRCINKCRYPNYGKACQNVCPCTESFCNFITGCDVTEHVNLTSDTMLHPMAQHTIERTAMGVIVSVSVLSSIIISAVISLIIWRLRGPYRSNRRASQNSSQQAQQKTTKPTNQQPKHASSNTNNRTNVYSSCDIAGPSHLQTASMEVYCDFSLPDCDRTMQQRESNTDTILFDISSCAYEPMMSTVREDNLTRV